MKTLIDPKRIRAIRTRIVSMGVSGRVIRATTIGAFSLLLALDASAQIPAQKQLEGTWHLKIWDDENIDQVDTDVRVNHPRSTSVIAIPTSPAKCPDGSDRPYFIKGEVITGGMMGQPAVKGNLQLCTPLGPIFDRARAEGKVKALWQASFIAPIDDSNCRIQGETDGEGWQAKETGSQVSDARLKERLRGKHQFLMLSKGSGGCPNGFQPTSAGGKSQGGFLISIVKWFLHGGFVPGGGQKR